MTAELVGVTFENRQSIIAKYCEIGKPVYLFREPDNQYDSNAVAVYIDAGKKREIIGYIGREQAKYYAERMDQGKQYDAVVGWIYGGNGINYGVNIDISMISKKELQRRAAEAAQTPPVNQEQTDTAGFFSRLKDIFNFRKNP